MISENKIFRDSISERQRQLYIVETKKKLFDLILKGGNLHQLILEGHLHIMEESDPIVRYELRNILSYARDLLIADTALNMKNKNFFDI